MKINDVILSEAPNYKGTAGAQAIAKANGITDVNKIQAGKVIQVNGQPYTIKAGDTLDKIAAANKVSAAPAAAADAGSGGADQNAPGVSPAVAAAQGKAPSNADELAKAQGKEVPAEAPAPAPAEAPADSNGASPGAAAALANMGKPTTTQPASAEDPARIAQLAGNNSRPAGGYGNFTGDQTAALPADQTVQAATPAPQTSPDTGLSTAPKPVTTGTGGKTNMVTGSDDEMAWRAKNPNWNMTGAQYPGAGQWDPRTGRSKKLQAQADANAASVKGFLNKINPFAKKAAPEQGATTQAVPPQPNVEMKPLTQSVDNNAEISRIKKLSGL